MMEVEGERLLEKGSVAYEYRTVYMIRMRGEKRRRSRRSVRRRSTSRSVDRRRGAAVSGRFNVCTQKLPGPCEKEKHHQRHRTNCLDAGYLPPSKTACQ